MVRNVLSVYLVLVWLKDPGFFQCSTLFFKLGMFFFLLDFKHIL